MHDAPSQRPVADRGTSTEPPLVDVVILSWNDGELLDLAVRSALGSDGVSVRVVVVDNGSREAVGPFDDDRVTVVRNPTNLGVAAGRNRGVHLGRSPYVLLLDSDAALAPASLRRMVEVLDADPSLGLVGPVFEGQVPEASAGRAPTLQTKLRRVSGRSSTYEPTRRDGDVWPVDVVIGACQCFRRVAYDSVGGIDERYFYGPEDVDFCMRLREIGWGVAQVDRAPVLHPPRRRNRSLFSRRGLSHAWAVSRFLWRHRHYSGTVTAA